MSICDRCKNKCKIDVIEIESCINFVGEAPRKIITNFDRITASPEALAEFIEEKCNCINCPTDCPAKGLCYDYRSCRRAMVMWLKQESKE